MSEKEEAKKGEGLKISRGERFKVEPSFITQRDPNTLVVGADFAKYMVDQDCGVGTLIFYRKYPTPKRDSRGWAIQEVVEESFLEVKLPLNTLFACAIDLYLVAEEIRKSSRKDMTYFGPSKIIQEEKPHEKSK